MQEFKQQLEQNVAGIEKILAEKLPNECTFQKNIAEAMKYSLMAGGKRLRPMLIWETYRWFAVENGLLSKEDKWKSMSELAECNQDTVETVACFMTAMEMIHTYSLVHDDLPAMDDDDYRRSRLTTHKVYGEAMGILAGDALLNYAYETAIQGVKVAKDKGQAIDALDVLSKRAGVYGMVGGQVVDVEMEGKEISQEQLAFIYELKTGALIQASMEIGALLGGALENQVEIIRDVAGKIGLAFQIQDDILDITSTTEVLGKPVLSDAKNQKQTYASIHGIEVASSQVERLTKEALAQMETLPGENTFLIQLLKSLVHREK